MRDISDLATDALRRIGEIGRATAAGVATSGMLFALIACDADTAVVDGNEVVQSSCDTYEAGMAKATDDGAYTVSIEASSQIPLDRGLNDLTLKVLDANGAPVDAGVTLVVEPWMPAHGHGSTNITATATGAAGIYDAPGVNFIMPGTWELRMLLSTNAASSGDAAAPREPQPTTDTTKAVFTFCVEG